MVTMPKLTHSDLSQLGTLLGYNLLDDGICQGFSCMWAQALLAKDEECFFNRLELIASYKPNFAALIKDYEAAKKKARQLSQLTQKDKDLLDLPPFYDGIEIYLNPEKHCDLFNRNYVNQDNLNIIYPFIQSKKLEQSKLGILFNKVHIFSKASLKTFLKDLEAQFKNAALELPILLDNFEHSVCLKYNITKQKWSYIDTNDFERHPGTATYFRELDTTELVSSLFESLSTPSVANLALSTTILSTTNQTPDLHAMKASLTQLDLNYPVTSRLTIPCDSRDLELAYQLACQKGNLKLVQIIIKHPKVKINQVTDDGVTPLYSACENGHLAVVKELLKHRKIDVNQERDEGTTPLFVACQNGHLPIVLELLKHPEIDINQERDDEVTPLFIACQNGHLAIVTELLKQPDILINKERNDETTPLYIACENGHTEVVAQLLKHIKIDVNQSVEEYTPLQIACYSGYADIVAVLLKHRNIEVNQTDNNGKTALYLACERGDLAVIIELLKHPKININQAECNGLSPLYIACQKGNLAIIRELLKHPKIKINQADYNQLTPLYIACQKGNSAIVEELLKHPKIRINQAESNGLTPLYIACQKGHLATIRELLKHPKIRVNKAESDGQTPLYIACQKGHLATIRELLKHPKIEINQAKSNGITPLHIACQEGRFAIIKELLKQPNIEINQAKNNGVTPLYTACQYNRLDIVELLLKAPGINMNSRGITNHTPLLVACLSPHTQNNMKLFKLLLDKGASLSHKNDTGQTALDIAFKQENKAALSVLLKFMLAHSMTPSALMSLSSLEKALGFAKAQCPEVAEYLTTYQSREQSIRFFEPQPLTNSSPPNDESLAPRNGG